MDTELYFTEKGSGKPLILLHGNGEDSEYFTRQTEFFSEEYRVIAVDTRGHGKSPRGNKPFTIRQFVEDLRDFMDRHKIPRAYILGFSDGGNIAMVFAVKYPERVDRLILNGANLNAGGLKLHIRLPIEAGYRFASLFAGRSTAAARKAELLGLMINDPNIASEELSAIRARTLVIAGTRDMIKRRHTVLIYKSLAQGKLAVIPGSHFIARDNPDEFNRIAGEFLRQP